MKGVDEDQPRNFFWMRAREGADDDAAERMADEDIRRRDAGTLKQQPKLADERSHLPGNRSVFAPREAGPVVTADAGEWRDFRLDPAPAYRRSRDARFEDDGRSAGALAPVMEAMTPDTSEFSRSRERPPVTRGADCLIDDAGERESAHGKRQECGPAHYSIMRNPQAERLLLLPFPELRARISLSVDFVFEHRRDAVQP